MVNQPQYIKEDKQAHLSEPTMKPTEVSNKHCHEYRTKGDLFPAYGFGSTPEGAREDAVYGADRPGDSARDHYLGVGDWKIETDERGAMWVTKINKSS